jgi:hypothetical protein
MCRRPPAQNILKLSAANNGEVQEKSQRKEINGVVPFRAKKQVCSREMPPMNRFRYVFAAVTLLSTFYVFFLHCFPYFSNQSVFIDLGCVINIILFVLWTLVMKVWRTVVSLLLAVLIINDVASSAYRTNNICDPGGHILRSEADAIGVAKEWASRSTFYGVWGVVSGADAGNAMDQAQDCCEGTRSRYWSGVIVWDVSMYAARGSDGIFMKMQLSNCGEIFNNTKFSTVETRKP